jgi:uncharacterized protein YegP (UPF0339 family)
MKIEIYSKKPLVGRRQWRWRAVHDNGNVMANGGEGYANREDMMNSIRTLRGLFPNAKLVDC